MPPLVFDSKYERLRQELPAEIESLARKYEGFSRARSIKSADELLYLVWLYSISELSLREIAGFCAGSGILISDEAVRQRLKNCPKWLEAILSKMLPIRNLPPGTHGNWRIVACDGSQISGPGSKGTDYRWHLAYDPVAQQISELHLSDAHTSESLTRFNLGQGDLVLGDRAYAKAKALIQTRALGAHLVVRMTPQYLKLWTSQGEQFDLVAALREQKDQTQLSFALEIRDGDRALPVWIHAHRLNENQRNKARRRLKRKATRRSSTLREETLFLSEWVLVLTTIPPEELSAEVILELYLVRWQIELLIKRYKSLLKAARVRAKKDSPLAEVYLLGKLIFAVLVEREAIKRLGNEWTQMNQARTATWWRIWKLIVKELTQAILNTDSWNDWDWKAVLRAIAERHRKRRLQVIPLAVAQWLKSAPLAASH
jgi:hypothetical protein